MRVVGTSRVWGFRAVSQACDTDERLVMARFVLRCLYRDTGRYIWNVLRLQMPISYDLDSRPKMPRTYGIRTDLGLTSSWTLSKVGSSEGHGIFSD